MKYLLYLFLVSLISTAGLSQGKNHTGYDSANEDHFGFLIFDKKKTEDFFKEYSPLAFQNKKIRAAVRDMADTRIEFDRVSFLYNMNTTPPDSSDFRLASEVLKAFVVSNGKRLFDGSLQYLFFYKCLPDIFRYKWLQTTMGDFEFNAVFFRSMSARCKVFEDIITGEKGFRDKKIMKVFKDYPVNEITAGNAKAIMTCIEQDTTFDDNRFAADKNNFIEFLDKVITGKWRMFLLDNN